MLIGQDLVSCGSEAGVREGAQEGELKSQTVMVESGGEDHQKELPPTPGKSMCSREAFPTADTLWGASYVTLARVTLSKQEAEIRDGSEKEPGENGKWGGSSLMGPSLSGDP